MVGLPARGKSFISRKISRFLQWRGLQVEIFNVGKYCREPIPDLCAHLKLFTLRESHRGGDRESFRENLFKKLVLRIFWTRRTLEDIENYALSKLQPPTTLGDTKNVKKTKK